MKSKLANRLALIVFVAYGWFMWSTSQDIDQRGRELGEERERLEQEGQGKESLER